MERKLIAIVGPTSSGKTGIGVNLAKKLYGEIISADSRQLYKRLDIGTGKDLSEYDGVPYHMIDVAEPGEHLTLFDYLPMARKAIEETLAKGKLPIIVGGTGLYVQALLEGFELNSHTVDITDKTSRKELEGKTDEELFQALFDLDEEAFLATDLNNRHRVIRAIERAESNEKPVRKKPTWESLQIGMDWPREELYTRIDKRVDERFEEGMLEEVVGLLNSGVDKNWLVGLGLEYRMIGNFLISNFKFPISEIELKEKLDGLEDEFEAMKQELKYKIHQYAKRQLTWLRRFPDIYWGSNFEEIESKVMQFLSDR